jgi:ComF family protein
MGGILDLLPCLLYPPRCAGCARDLVRPSLAGLCRACRTALGEAAGGCPRCGDPSAHSTCLACTRQPPPFRRARACFPYREGGLSGAYLARWKYQGDLVLGASLARLLAAHRLRAAACYEVLVPVPLHSARLARRGFNQAAVLAWAARLPGERVAHGVLHRLAETASQAALGRGARARNVRAAFALRDPRPVRGRAVLLIDDVHTTGATLGECARLLHEAQARLVDVWTLARTPRTRLPLPPGSVAEGAP